MSNDCIAIDCEMVGVGHMGSESALARVSIVNYYGEKLFDKFVKPKRVIRDYRTQYSGITAKHLENAADFDEVQLEVQELLKEKLIIGQSPGFDFKALELEWPVSTIRDTAQYYYLFGNMFGRRQPINKKPSLKRLANEVLGLNIQKSSHDSIEDARICMLLYRLKQTEWENNTVNKSAFTSLDVGKCRLCGSTNHVRRQCPRNPWRS
ncbi:ribonuclease H-like domain-containing protein [Glomus cerebriforme]|uniref:RNA exonuclease 4 n=1 Tax=Glomus cerebriforme TaxID=658196 RepID=A0A397S0Y6_9GLOM|nr:ribonuclease H-like domain-containing protein [Glomus cerebriforme]